MVEVGFLIDVTWLCFYFSFVLMFCIDTQVKAGKGKGGEILGYESPKWFDAEVLRLVGF